MKPSFFIPLLTAAYASAHGYVASITIDGQSFQGNVPNGATNPSIIRQISDVSPVKGANNPDVNCGMNAKVASDVADANPGSVMTFDWKGGDGSNWPHNTGPMFTYMASCGSTTCDKFDSTTAKWFKIQQVGRKENGDWAQIDLMGGATAKITLPSNIAPGNYLIRHEIIALHLGTQMGGAEFYPSCAQIRVGGNGNGAPAADELVSLPGAYSDNDPGIFDPSVYDTSAPYTFPGPAIAAFVNDAPAPGSGSGAGSGNGNGSGNSSGNGNGNGNGGGNGNGNGNGNGSGSSTSSAAPAGSTKAPSTSDGSSSGSSGSCHLKKSSSSNVAAATGTTPSAGAYKPRHVSRVMRDLVFGKRH